MGGKEIYHWTRCSDDHCVSRSYVVYETEAKAIAAWNTRPQHPAAPAPQPDGERKGHLIDGEFQSDKYPTTPRGKVPLSVNDKTAQDLLWEYAQRRRSVDAEFSADLETVLRNAGYAPAQQVDYAPEVMEVLISALASGQASPAMQAKAAERLKRPYESRAPHAAAPVLPEHITEVTDELLATAEIIKAGKPVDGGDEGWIRNGIALIDRMKRPRRMPIRDKMWPDASYKSLDVGIRFAVHVLHAGGFDTCQSCQGGKGHAYDQPTVEMIAGADDALGFGALKVLQAYGLPVRDVAILWPVQHGLPYEKLWRITFFKTMEDRADEVPIFIHCYRASAAQMEK
jgi:hypothetical protein